MENVKNVLSIDDDVLLLIISLLSHKDARAVACMSKYAYCLATPSTLHDASYPYNRRESETSRWEYILGDDKYLGVPRRRYLRALGVWTYPKDETEMASLLEALPSFSNLRSLHCGHSSRLIEQHPRFVEGIPNLVRLTEIELQEFFSTTLPSLSAVLAAPHLTNVTLSLPEDPEDNEYWDVSQGFALLTTLAALPSLSTLSLICPAIGIPPRSTTMRTIPMLSSLRHMFIKLLVSEASANIVAYCPNLITLELGCWETQGVYEMKEDHLAHLSLLTKDIWPSIHELDCSMPWSTSFTDCLGRARKVTIHDRHLDHHEDYLPILSKTLPSCLHLMYLKWGNLEWWPSMDQFETEHDLVKYAWKEVANTLPQLRSLVLGLYDTALNGDFMSMLLDALLPLPLTYLSLQFNAPYTPLMSKHTAMAHANEMRAAEVLRVDTLRALPDALLRALPHVRVFSLLGCKAILNFTDLRSGRSEPFWEDVKPDFDTAIQAQDAVDEEWGETSPQVDEHLRELRRRADETAGLRNERWWWVEGEGEERRAIEIWKEKGEWARDVIESVDFQPGDLTGMFSDSWRYDP
ncbi:uncharacterized protein BXZ73DRAFT_109408 [Epithele typhae]|uniref:uncharacterized protein n=1 Tax=Epithele typhae TaxID=378194 RepID=UPI0020074EF7|nr:uncharacterized protein BXZ73DRAFT_109408 [Epithele typhae]KAH9910177.1 hypothetical protein BXZ73DRAFT_109408 [Epithele typhae]